MTGSSAFCVEGMIPSLAFISLVLGHLVGIYTMFKRYQAPKQRLRSYLHQDVPRWMEIFAFEERFTKYLKAAH